MARSHLNTTTTDLLPLVENRLFSYLLPLGLLIISIVFSVGFVFQVKALRDATRHWHAITPHRNRTNIVKQQETVKSLLREEIFRANDFIIIGYFQYFSSDNSSSAFGKKTLLPTVYSRNPHHPPVFRTSRSGRTRSDRTFGSSGVQRTLGPGEPSGAATRNEQMRSAVRHLRVCRRGNDLQEPDDWEAVQVHAQCGLHDEECYLPGKMIGLC